MNLIFTSVVLLIFLIAILKYDGTVEDYVSFIYKPSKLELNPLTVYTEKNDIPFLKKILKGIPIKITSKESDKFESDVVFLPSNFSSSKTNSDYRLLSKMTKLPLYLIAKTSSKVKRFEDINFQTNLGVRAGYSREIITDILNRDSMSPRIIEYESDQDAKNLFKTGEIDVLCMIDQQPSRFSQEISNSYGVNFIKVLNRESILTTDMNLIRYKTNIISTTLRTSAFYLSLFVRKDIPAEVIYEITDRVFKPHSIIRSLSIEGDRSVDFHEGTRSWLIDNGFISVDVNQPKGCALLAGKSKCEGHIRAYAKKVYSDNFPFEV